MTEEILTVIIAGVAILANVGGALLGVFLSNKIIEILEKRDVKKGEK